jgi:hypothetical protein
VQTILPLENSDGAALRLTMAKYYTPSGICIHGIGIEPDLDLPNDELTESTMTVYAKQMIEKYAGVMVKEGTPVQTDADITPAEMDKFVKYCLANVKKIDGDELKKDLDYLKESLYVEVIRETDGEKAAREKAVLFDPQVKVAEQIIDNNGKISAKLLAQYPKLKNTGIAGEKKLEEERNKNKQDNGE